MNDITWQHVRHPIYACNDQNLIDSKAQSWHITTRLSAYPGSKRGEEVYVRDMIYVGAYMELAEKCTSRGMIEEVNDES